MEYLGFHQIAYAHALAVDDYRFSFTTSGFGNYRARESETSGVMEVGYVVENPLVIDNLTLGESYTAYEGDIFIFPPEHDISVHALNHGAHKHITSEYMIDARVTIHRGLSVQDAAPAQDRSIVLPYIIPASPAKSTRSPPNTRCSSPRAISGRAPNFARCSRRFAVFPTPPRPTAPISRPGAVQTAKRPRPTSKQISPGAYTSRRSPTRSG